MLRDGDPRGEYCIHYWRRRQGSWDQHVSFSVQAAERFIVNHLQPLGYRFKRQYDRTKNHGGCDVRS